MRNGVRFFCILLISLFAASSEGRAQEDGQVSNLVYTSWADSSVGEYVIQEQTELTAEGTTLTRTRMDLLSLDADQLRLRISITQKKGERWVDVASEESVISAWTSAEAGARQRKMSGAQKEGDKKIDVVGRSVDAHWFLMRDFQNEGEIGMDVLTKTTISDGVPGRIAEVDQEVYWVDNDMLIYTKSSRVVEWSRVNAPASR